MGKTKVFLCSEEETVELGEARVELEFEDRPRELPIELSAVILRDVDFPAESAADAAVTSLQADVEFYQKNSDYWHKTYNLLMEQRRRDWSERIDLVAQNDELRSEVERLKESRKEQAEKHRQKMRNLQQNFEQQASGKTRNTKLKKDLENAKAYSHRVEQINKDLRGQVADLQAKLDSVPGYDSYWHEKCLDNETELTIMRDAYRRVLGQRNELSRENSLLSKGRSKMVDDYNRLNNDINRFMKDFAEGATVINRAVDAWNATVPE